MDARRRKPKRQQDEPEQTTKEEYAVAKHLRFNLSTREGKLRGMPVVTFTGEKAVDMLMDSKWATNKGKTQALFTTRASCVDYCNNLLIKGLFHRAAKVEKKKDRTSKKSEVKEENKESNKKSESKDENGKKPDAKDDEEKEKKKKRKLRLEMHDQQFFVDGDEIYVWIYDPTPLKNKIIGLLLVLGAIAVCLFPLWPPEVRLGVYYVSLTAAAFVSFILVLCVVRHVLFVIVWLLTFGKHHLWILPNLTEDVGFFESFQPLYKHDSYSKSDEKEKEDSKEENNPVDEESSPKEETSEPTEVQNDGSQKASDLEDANAKGDMPEPSEQS